MTSLPLDDVVAAFPEFHGWDSVADQGGHKSVYFIEVDGEPSALKILRIPVSSEDDEGIETRGHYSERLRREVEALKRIDSPYIARILEGPEEREIAGRAYLWYREPRYGRSLQRRITEDGPLAPTDVCDLLRALLSAEKTLNENRLVHRDIKPLNILEHPTNGHPVLIDLGVALHLDLPRITEVTATRTNLFAAPEQFDHTRNVDHRTDLFQIGVTAYYTATGRHPFISEGEQLAPADYFRRMSDGPDLQPLVDSGMSERLAQYIERCMASRPNLRFRTMELAIGALSEACS